MKNNTIVYNTYMLSYSNDEKENINILDDFDYYNTIYLFTLSQLKKVLKNEVVALSIISNIKTEKKYREFFLYNMINIYLDVKNNFLERSHILYFIVYDNNKVGIVSANEQDDLILINDFLLYSRYKEYKDEHFVDFCLGLCSFNKNIIFPENITSIKNNRYLLSRNVVLKENKIDFNIENNNEIPLSNTFYTLDNFFYFVLNKKNENEEKILSYINKKHIMNINNHEYALFMSSIEKRKKQYYKELISENKSLIKDINNFYYIPEYLKGKLR